MRYAHIDNYNIENGPGTRVVLWTQGCPHHCPGCHNPHTWSDKAGKEFGEEEMQKILAYLVQYFKKDFSVLGGEPLAPYNRDGVKDVCKRVKEALPETNIWLWTGYEWDEVKHLSVMDYVDVVVDGKFIEELKDKDLQYRGSSNQRVIDVKASLREGKLISYND